MLLLYDIYLIPLLFAVFSILHITLCVLLFTHKTNQLTDQNNMDYI